MKVHYSGLVLAVGVTFLGWTHAVSATESEQPKRVIVQVKGTNAGDIEGDIVSSKSDRKQTILQVDVPKGTSTSSFIKELEKEDNVLHVEEDRLLNLTYSPNDYYFYAQSHHQNIHSEEAWNRSMGANVTVAILDNGIDLNHEDLASKITDPYDVVYDSPYTLTSGDHGTHVAGIVGSSIDNYYGGTGVAPYASIMPIDVFAGTSAYTSDVIKGIYRAVDHGANIINMSLGNYYYSSSFQDAINYAYNRDVLVIAAAGNDATSSAHYPSSYDHVISVGSTTSTDGLSDFSNYGSNIDITAPGSSIYSTVPYNSYSYYSGTSMASPVVAGVAALIKSYDYSLSADAITDRLTSTADDLGTAGRDDYFGYGRVNAKSALQIQDLSAVSVNEVSDISDYVSGYIPWNNGYGSLYVFDSWGNQLAYSSEMYGDDYFKLPISRLTAGTELRVMFTDYYGNSSPTTYTTVVDRTAPLAPTLSEVTDQTTVISGKAEADSVISVKVKSKEIGRTTVGKDGAFKVTIPKQAAGTTLTATATDSAGNVSSAVTVPVTDKTSPVLQVNQITNRSVMITGTTEAKAKVQLVYATKTMETVADTNGQFNFSIATPKTGAEFTFMGSDASGNKSDMLTLNAIDATLPILKGATDTTIEAGSPFDPKIKVTALDETDGDLTKSISIAGKVDNKKLGLYRLTYSVKDKAGNETKQIRNVKVKDTVKPVISGAKNQSINLNSSFNAKSGVTAKDNIDGVITKNIKVSGTVNVKKVGVYTLAYKVSDASGNTVTTLRKITVKDNVKPTISGAKSKTIKYKSSFNPKTGVTAKDNVDGVLTKSIKVMGSVNTKRKGVYALTYSVKDKAGNSTSVKVKIKVK